MARPKKVKKEEDGDTGLKSEIYPYEVGQVVCDIKITTINPDSCRPIAFVYAKRGVEKFDPIRKKNVFYPEMIARTPQGKVIWQEQEHCMTVEDFQRMITGRRERESDAV